MEALDFYVLEIRPICDSMTPRDAEVVELKTGVVLGPREVFVRRLNPVTNRHTRSPFAVSLCGT